MFCAVSPAFKKNNFLFVYVRLQIEETVWSSGAMKKPDKYQ